jgi:hypothetical protein
LPRLSSIDWSFSFIRAVRQVCLPSAARRVFCELETSDRLLSQFGWALLCLVPAFALFAYWDSATLANVVNPWIKPIKFAISVATFAWSISFFLRGLEIPFQHSVLARRAIVLSVTVEMLSLISEACRRGKAGHKLFDVLIAHTPTAMISLVTGVVLWLLVAFCTRSRTRFADAAMVASIRLSIGIFLIGSAIGGCMLAHGSHTVGAPDGGSGLPFLNWSTVAGDMQIAHFVAIHAIQILPLFAHVLAQMSPKPPLKSRLRTVYAASALLLFVVGSTFVQACLARPFIALSR